VGPRACLIAVEKRKISCLAKNQTPAIQPFIIPTELSWLPVWIQQREKYKTPPSSSKKPVTIMADPFQL
jgi:hypothetical protein